MLTNTSEKRNKTIDKGQIKLQSISKTSTICSQNRISSTIKKRQIDVSPQIMNVVASSSADSAIFIAFDTALLISLAFQLSASEELK
jgi:hypothetical protein